MPFVKVAEKKDVPLGRSIAVDVAGKRVAIFNVDGHFYAIDDACSHAGGTLSEGSLAGDVVTCPWHGATFNVKTGTALSAPAFDAVSSYKVKAEGNDLHIEIE